jgi:hypothetical protein
MVVMVMGLAIGMVVIVFVPVKRQRPLGPQPEQRAIFWRGRNDPWGAFAADMPVQADHPVTCRHHHMQIVADHQNRRPGIPPHFLDQAIE